MNTLVNGQVCFSAKDHVGTQERIMNLLVKGSDLLGEWHQRLNQRRSLQSLSDHQLKDIGLSRAEVFQEVAKPFWEK